MHLLVRLGTAFGFTFAFSTPLAAQATTFEELGRSIPGFSEAGAGGFAVADFDDDSQPDLAIPETNGGSALVEVLGETGSGLGAKQFVLLPDTSLVRVLVSHSNGAPRLYTIADDGTVRELGGWPLAELRNFHIDGGATLGAAIGDIDADGNEELVVTAPTSSSGGAFVAAYDLASGTQRWTLPGIGGTDVLLEQLDADAAPEIVIAGVPGVILDGATQTTDWSYEDGFGSYLAGGHFETTGGAQFVAARDWDFFTVFQSAPYSPVWDTSVFDIDAIATADIDGDGFDEIVEGDGQWGSINVYDGQSHDIRLSIPHSAWGVSALAIGGFGAGGADSIAFASRQAVLDGEELMRVVDASNGANEWEIDATMPGPYSPVALGDVDGNGSSEFLYASEGNGYSQGVIEQVDAVSGTSEWESPIENGNANDPYYMSPVALSVLPGIGGAAGRIIVAGTSLYSGRILGVDGASHDVLYQIGTYAAGPMNDRYLADMVTTDLDDDGTPDIAVCTYAADTGTSGVRLFVFSSADGSLTWESIAMGSGFDVCNGVMAGHFDDGASQLIVAVLPTSLRAFDAQTHLLAWTLPVAADGATLLAHGVDGREIVVFSGSTLTFFDAATRTELRQVDVGAEVRAVREPRDIRTLIVAAGGKLLLVDGISGNVAASTEFLGNGLGAANQLAIEEASAGSYLIGVGSDVGAFRYRIALSDAIFMNGFDAAP
jgi:hypothetical protein